LERDNHCGAIIGAIPICAVVYDRWSKLSVKLFMKKTIFFLIFIIFAGCAQKAPKPQAPAVLNKITNAVPSEAAPATEAVPAPSKKIDYDAINKDILKDVSKKIVDKASKKD
jgi:hypothetical protein